MSLARAALITVIAVLGFAAAATQPALAAGSHAQATAAVRVVSGGARLEATRMSVSTVSATRASAAGIFTVTRPGASNPWFLTLRLDTPAAAPLAVSFRTEAEAPGLRLDGSDRRVAWGTGSSGAGRFEVPGYLDIVSSGPVATAGVARLTASVTSGP